MAVDGKRPEGSRGLAHSRSQPLFISHEPLNELNAGTLWRLWSRSHLGLATPRVVLRALASSRGRHSDLGLVCRGLSAITITLQPRRTQSKGVSIERTNISPQRRHVVEVGPQTGSSEGRHQEQTHNGVAGNRHTRFRGKWPQTLS